MVRPAPPTELRKQGVFVSPSGVRSIWLRHDLANFKARLKALETKVRRGDGIILTEAHIRGPGAGLGKEESRRRSPAARWKRPTPAIWVHRTPSMSAP